MKNAFKIMITVILCMGISGCLQSGRNRSLPSSPVSDIADAKSTSGADMPPADAQANLYEAILLNFGAGKTTDERGEPRLQTSGLSFYYLPDTENFAALSPDSYFSWYLSMSNKENLTYEERLVKYKSPFGEDTGWFFPQDDYEPLIQQYFDVSTEHLRSGDAYQADYGGYWLDGGMGLGIRPYILLYKAEQKGDVLSLYHTHITGEYDLIHAPNEYKILSVRLKEDGSYQYLSYKTDQSPSSGQIAAARQDNTGFLTGTDVFYDSKELGLAVRFPDGWKNNYTHRAGALYFSAAESEDIVGATVEFLYKDQGYAVLGRINAVPAEVWDIVGDGSSSYGVVLGKNSRYVFTWDTPHDNLFAPGADHDLFEEMCAEVQDMTGRVTITEPDAI